MAQQQGPQREQERGGRTAIWRIYGMCSSWSSGTAVFVHSIHRNAFVSPRYVVVLGTCTYIYQAYEETEILI